MRSEKTGKKSEKVVEDLLVQFGYECIPWEKMRSILDNNKIIQTESERPIKYYAKNVPLGICLYKYIKKREEFLMYHSKLYPRGCIVTVKWQQVPGTGYEKAPYLLWNVLKYYNEFPTIIIWDGNFDVAGVKSAYECLKETCENPGVCPVCGGSIDDKKLLGIYTQNEFLRFANRGGI